MFLVRLYDENYSYKKLVESCKETETFGQAVDDPYQVRINIKMLNKKLASLDKSELHKRKQDLNKIYWVIYVPTFSRSFFSKIIIIATITIKKVEGR